MSVGHHKQDKPHGQVTTLFKDGRKQVAMCRDGQAHGKVHLTYSDGKIVTATYDLGK